MMESAAAAMLEAGVGRFRGPSLAALLAEIWAPLAVALAALATLPSLFRRLQMLILRLRSRGKEVISSHIYYSSGDDDDDSGSDGEDDDEGATSSCSSGEEESETTGRRIGYYEGAHDGALAWGGAVVRTWHGLPRRFPSAGLATGGGGGLPAVRLWGACTASNDNDGDAWWDADADEGAAAEAPVVVGWHARRRRRNHLQSEKGTRRVV